MSKEVKVLIIILIAIAIDRLCTVVDSNVYYDPFLFYDLHWECGDTVYSGVNLQYILKAVSVHVSVILLLWCIQIGFPDLKKALKFSMIVEALGIIDFFLIYEQSFFSIGIWDVEFTDFRIAAHGLIIGLWKSGKL